ncbi:PE family protein, partial [Mycobacterium marinum]
MSFVFASPEVLGAAAAQAAVIGSGVQTAGAGALGADEVSVAVAQLFDGHGQAYQAISAQAAVFHGRFVAALNAAADSYAGAEAAGVSVLQSAGADVMGALNAPTMAWLGRPLIGDGANGVDGTGGNGGAGGLLWGNGGRGGSGAAGQA